MKFKKNHKKVGAGIGYQASHVCPTLQHDHDWFMLASAPAMFQIPMTLRSLFFQVFISMLNTVYLMIWPPPLEAKISCNSRLREDISTQLSFKLLLFVAISLSSQFSQLWKHLNIYPVKSPWDLTCLNQIALNYCKLQGVQ